MKFINAKLPEECESITDIREAIDLIDDQIISLFALRYKYTCSAYRFKDSRRAVQDSKRVKEVLKKVRCKAIEKDFDPTITMEVYTKIIQHCINEQLKIWEKER